MRQGCVFAHPLAVARRWNRRKPCALARKSPCWRQTVQRLRSLAHMHAIARAEFREVVVKRAARKRNFDEAAGRCRPVCFPGTAACIQEAGARRWSGTAQRTAGERLSVKFDQPPVVLKPHEMHRRAARSLLWFSMKSISRQTPKAPNRNYHPKLSISGSSRKQPPPLADGQSWSDRVGRGEMDAPILTGCKSGRSHAMPRNRAAPEIVATEATAFNARRIDHR